MLIKWPRVTFIPALIRANHSSNDVNEKRTRKTDSVLLLIFCSNPYLISRPIKKYGVSTNRKFLSIIYGNSLFRRKIVYLPKTKYPSYRARVKTYKRFPQSNLSGVNTIIKTYNIAPEYHKCQLNANSLRNMNLTTAFIENTLWKKSAVLFLSTTRNNFHKKYSRFNSIKSLNIFLIYTTSLFFFATSE